jgi:hypothetical protein
MSIPQEERVAKNKKAVILIIICFMIFLFFDKFIILFVFI